MKFFELFFLVLLGNCGFSYGATKNIPWRNSFTHPYNKRFPGLRITGGQAASPHQFPYQVAMNVYTNEGARFCGGSLISENYVLTAAHCAVGALSFTLIFGAQNVTYYITDNSEEAQQRQNSTSYVIHPDYDRNNSLVNDLAIVKLTEPVTLNEYVQVVKLASGNDTYAGKEGTASGWGYVNDEDKTVGSELRYISKTILSNTECNEGLRQYNTTVQDVHLCLTGPGLCPGDSGGPLVSNGLQIGIASFIYVRCESDTPSVFARVSQFTDWIEANSDVTF